MTDAEIERSQGIIKFFDQEKGYGFIRRKGQCDVFLHVNTLKKCGIGDLAKGDKVEFDVMPVDKGSPKAVNVKVIPL